MINHVFVLFFCFVKALVKVIKRISLNKKILK